MPNRSYTSQSYRYGFNGQEKVDEIAGVGNHTTALFWEYDTRLGRRWNQDPKPNPSISNYAAFADNPLWFSDFLGDTTSYYNKGELVFTANDGLEDAIVDISDLSKEDLNSFNTLLNGLREDKQDDILHSDALNKFLRNAGPKYYIKDYISFWDENKNDVNEKGGINEHATLLIDFTGNGDMKLSGLNVKGGNVINIYGDKEIHTEKSLYQLGWKIGENATLHTHLTNNGASDSDMAKRNVGNLLHVVVGKDIITFHGNGQYFNINKNKLFPQTE